MELPQDAPTWLVALALVVGWISSNVWPVLRHAIADRLGASNAALRARAETELARLERQIAAEEAKALAEQKIAEAIFKLTELVQVNIDETRESKKTLTSLANAFSMQISQMPTLRDIQMISERISAIEVHLAQRYHHFRRRDQRESDQQQQRKDQRNA